MTYIYSIWEEKEYTKPKRKSLLHEENEHWIIIIKITNNARKREWRGIMRKLTTEEFITKAKLIHGDKYDYSFVRYTTAKVKIDIGCKIHGKFSQLPDHHLRGYGCFCCGINRTSQKNQSNSEVFIKNATKLHKKKYDYSLCHYEKSSKLIDIICKIHGKFQQTPNNHLRNHGCPKCAIEFTGNLFLDTHSDFLRKAIKVHSNKYDYSKSSYMGRHKKITLICRTHGEFQQEAGSHLMGNGCPKCTHIISKPETEFLDHLSIPLRNYHLPEWRQKAVDGYDPKTNIVYEFLGDYWHGNLSIFSPNKIHPKRKITYKKINSETMIKLSKVKSFGYTVKYIWEKEWNEWKKNKSIPIPTQTF